MSSVDVLERELLGSDLAREVHLLGTDRRVEREVAIVAVLLTRGVDGALQHSTSMADIDSC